MSEAALYKLTPEEAARVLDAHDRHDLKAQGVKGQGIRAMQEIYHGKGCILQVAWSCLRPIEEATKRGLNPGTIENTLAKFDWLYDPDNGAHKLSRTAFRQLLEDEGFLQVTH